MNRFVSLLVLNLTFLSSFAQDFVDLGLSVNWCSVNLGARTPEQSGETFAWGETEPRESFSMESYKYKDPENDQWTLDIGKNISGTSYDAASLRNPDWRLPTQKEFLELCKMCSWQWISDSNTSGYRVTGPNGNSIFLPIGGVDAFGSTVQNTGNYWSGTLSQGLGRTAICLSFDDNNYTTRGTYKVDGKLIRPVMPNPDYTYQEDVPAEWSVPEYAELLRLIREENYDEAFNVATMLAAMGDDKAQCVLATMYMCGVGTLRNYESAQELLVQAAQQGNLRAEYMLGGFGSLAKSHEFTRLLVGDDEELLYAEDNNFWFQMLSTETKPETYKDAFTWFYLQDGEWGYRDIMYYAAIVLIRGDYGYTNQENGLQWLVKSAKLGYGDALRLLQELMGVQDEE